MSSAYTQILLKWLTGVTFFVASAHASNLKDCHFEALYRAEAQAFIAENLYGSGKQEYLNEVSNARFMRVNRKFRNDKTVNMHREMGVLKLLNDKTFKNKEVSAAALNLDKNIYFPNLLNSTAAKALESVEAGGRYNDFKSVRPRFSLEAGISQEQIQKELIRIHLETAEEFRKKLLNYPHLAKAFQDSHYIRLQDPALWYEMGIGRTSAKAATMAKLRRSDAFLHKAGKENYVFGDAAIQEVASVARKIEILRQDLAQRLQDHSMFEERFPSEPMIEILRRMQNTPEIVTFGDYLKHIRSAAHRRWSDTEVLDDRTVQAMQSLFRLMNEVAPPTWSEEQEPIHLADMSRADKGVWSFDIRGQNSRNLYGVIESLHQAHLMIRPGELDSEFVDRILEYTATRQDLESRRFMQAIAHLEQSLIRNGLMAAEQRDRISRSGDDLVHFPQMDLLSNPSVYARTIEDLAGNGFEGSLYRSVLQSQTFTNGAPIPRSMRLDIISTAEGVEKNLRMALEGSDSELVPFNQWREAALSLRLSPVDENHVLVDLDVGAGKNKLTSPQLSVIRDKLRNYLQKHPVFPKGWDVREVKALPELYNPNP